MKPSQQLAPPPEQPAPAPKPPAKPAEPPASTAQVTAERPATPAPTPATAPRTEVARKDLPESVRQQLPALQLSGVSYSSNPQHRMAIVNGQVLREGEQGAPGLVLERIDPQQTVWSFNGNRFAMPLR